VALPLLGSDSPRRILGIKCSATSAGDICFFQQLTDSAKQRVRFSFKIALGLVPSKKKKDSSWPAPRTLQTCSTTILCAYDLSIRPLRISAGYILFVCHLGFVNSSGSRKWNGSVLEFSAF
jgi:hypothetical protein